MTVFLGYTGHVRLRRSTELFASSASALPLLIGPEDVNTTLNRAGFDAAVDNIITGDRVELYTDDPRGLVFFPATTWPEQTQPQNTISAFVNVNAAGGLRFFPTFAAAVNNSRSNEYPLQDFSGEPIEITFRIRGVDFNILGNVKSYELNTEREDIDTTVLSDRFRQRYSAGLISGNGQITTFFDFTTTGITETPLLMLQVIQRLDVGSNIDLALYLSSSDTDASQNVYYEVEAMVTRAGVTVTPDSVIESTIDFVTTGELRLLVGKPSGYILKEDDYRIYQDQSLDFLLTEVED
jgi:hypothetical protein